ncbi:MAG: class I SAM-dependent RNA methyltransferase [Parvibaculaceae bacterium]|nr:class I SAM-dependent RNA methyltransferase [Parvibaculaceae bacterium]
MNVNTDLEIFLVTSPGLEELLCLEAIEKGFKKPKVDKGGVTVKGSWQEVWRANLVIRGASKVLVRIDTFRVVHLSQLDKRARRTAWSDFLPKGISIRVEASSKGSRIYHEKAAAERIAKAVEDELGATLSEDADINIKARILNDICTISIDTSGELLHKRGHKVAVNKAPMRENLSSLMLRQCGFKGKETVIDPMCGSGTFVIEAAETAAYLNPGRSRTFAFEKLTSFDESAWQDLRNRQIPKPPSYKFYGYDRDAGAIKMSKDNADRADVSAYTQFHHQSITDLTPPEGDPGLIIINPPYGGRIGNKKDLYPLYQSIGKTVMARFAGWRVGLVTSTPELANQTGLPFTLTSNPISHGGIGIKIYSTDPLD